MRIGSQGEHRVDAQLARHHGGGQAARVGHAQMDDVRARRGHERRPDPALRSEDGRPLPGERRALPGCEGHGLEPMR